MTTKFSHLIATFLLITSYTLFSMEKETNQKLRERIRTFPVTDKEKLQKSYSAGITIPLSDEQAQGLTPKQRRDIGKNNYEKLSRDYNRMIQLQATCCCTMVGLIIIGGYLATHFFDYLYQ